MKKCVKQIKTSKYIIGLNGATTYVYDLNENLIKMLKDIKSVYNAYVSMDEKILCLKSTDTYLAFYDMDTFELINKISLKKCHQPQDSEGVFEINNNFINLQYTDRLTSDIVIYDSNNYTEKKRYSYGLGIVLESIDIVDGETYIVGFIRPNKADFHINEIKKYIFKFDEGKLNGLEISNKDHFVYAKLGKFVHLLHDSNSFEKIMEQHHLTKEEICNNDCSNLKLLWNKYKKDSKIITENAINL